MPKSSIEAEFYELEAGRRVHRAFLASVRVLGEGVDITGERGVDSICFADTRGSQVEIVQNIGRALRLNKDGSTKVARIIVPVFLEPGGDPTDMVASASFRPLVAVLQGLRSHDERLVEQLASRALTSGKRKVHVRRDEDGQIVGAGGEGDSEDQEDDDTQAAAEAALLHFSSPRDAAMIAAFLRTRVYRPESLVWLEGYQALLRWRKENEITGFYAVPYDVEVGVTKNFPLGRWVHQQRKALRAGELEERRKTLLDAPEAGMVWEPGEEAWENKLAALRSYRRAMGHLTPRQDAVWGEGEAMVPIGQHMANLRRKGTKNGLGKNETPRPPGPHNSPRSTRTGTARGHWTGSGTTASSRTWSTPTVSCPRSSPACRSRATTSASDSSDRRTLPPGRSFSRSSRNASPRWASNRLRRRLLHQQPRAPRRVRARHSKHSSAASRPSRSGSNARATGRCRTATPRRSRSTARRSQ